MASATRLLWLDVSIGAPRSLATGDTVDAPGDWTFSEDVVISGDLTVNGTTTTINTQDVLIADRFTLHNSNYTTATAVTAGITFNVDPAATSFAITSASDNLAAAGTVTAGDDGFVVSTDPTATLTAGDIIITTGATTGGNNGIWEVKGVSTAPNQVAIKTSPDTSVSGIVNTVITNETYAGTLVQTQITVIRADSTGGTMSIGSGDATPLTFATIETGAGGSATLQTAYVNGNTITTSAAEGNIIFQGTEDFVVGGSVDVDMNTSGFVSLDAAAASNFTVTGAGIDLSLQSAAGRTVIEGGEAAADAVRIQATNAAGGIDIDSGTAGTLIDSTGAISLDGVGASNFTTDTGNLTLSTTTSGTLALTSAGAWTVDAEDDSTINVAGNLTTLLDETQTADTATAGNAYTVTTGIGSVAGATNVGGIGGNLHLFGGAGGAASASNNDGGAGAEIHLLPGTGGTGATAQAGGTGGELKLDGGTGGAPGTGQGGIGGAITITGGTGGAGTGTQAGRNGGLTSIDAGAGGADGGAGAGQGGKMEIGRNNAITIDGGSSITEWNLFASALGGFDFSSAAAETQELFSLTTTGTNGDSTEFFVGQSDPSAGAGVAAPVSSIFFRDSGGSGTTGELWLKTGVANTAWEQFQTGADPTSLQTAYDTGNTITTSAAEGGAVAITTTVDETNSGLTVTAGTHTVSTAQDLVALTGTANQSGDLLALANSGSGSGIDLDSTNTSPNVAQIDVGYGSTVLAAAATPTGLSIDYGTANLSAAGTYIQGIDIDMAAATVGSGDAYVVGIFLDGTNGTGSTETFGIQHSAAGLGGGFDVGIALLGAHSSALWLDDNSKIQFGTRGGTATTAGDMQVFYDPVGLGKGRGLFVNGTVDPLPAGGGNGNGFFAIATAGGDATGVTNGGVGGAIDLIAGAGGSASTGTGNSQDGGTVYLESGAGGNADATGPENASNAGGIQLIGGGGGNGAGAGTAGAGALIYMEAGFGGNGTATVAGGAGGNVQILSGDAGNDGGAGAGTFGVISLESYGTETHEVVALVNATNTVELYTGTSTPNGAVTGSAGSLFLRDTGSSGEVYVNTSTGSGTAWTLLSAAGGTTLQSAYEAGNTIVTSAAEGDFDVSGTEAISLDTTGTASNLNIAANDAGDATLTIGVTNAGAGDAILDIDAMTIDIDTGPSGVITIDAGAGGSTGINTSSGFSQNTTIGHTSFVTALALNSGSGGITVVAGNGGGIDITSAGDMATTAPATSSTAWVLDDGTNTYLTLDSTNTQLELGQFMDTGTNVGQGLTYTNNSGGSITAGKLVSTDTNTTLQIIQADATGGSATNLTSRITGVAMETIANAASGKVNTAYGVHVNVIFTGAVATTDIGKVAYLDTTGNATLTAPSASGDFVVEVGIVQGANGGAGTAARVLFAPRFVAAIA